MSAEELRQIFLPFYTTKEVGQGTGLGLAQVYGIVKQHQGYIAVDTVPDQGTTFALYLPAQGVPEEREGEPDAQQAEPPRGRGEAILLVEDDDGVRLYCRELLDSLGYRVLVAKNGQEALEMYQAQAPIDLLLTDLVMPLLGGRELIGMLRTVTPTLKTIVLTGYTATDLAELRAQGINEIVQKPFTGRVLAQVVRRVLDA